MKLSEIHGVPIARWGYEQAFCTNFIIVFERDDEWMEIERFWAKSLGSHQDNKVTFKLAMEYGDGFYVTFHDCKVYIGTGVRPYRGGVLSEPTKKTV